ncbi:MAG: carboxyl-terminal processing protease, partial [Chloroflexota bacterium]|nr:carboxyl-terminal processing protease [Chloroflexota bacterium]
AQPVSQAGSTPDSRLPDAPGSLWPPTMPLNTEPGARPGWAPPVGRPRAGGLPSVTKVVVAIIALVAVFGAGIGLGKLDSARGGPSGAIAVPASLPPEFATYTQAWQILHDKYVDPAALDPKLLTYGSIDGLVQAVGDTGHTRFLTPDEVREQHTALSGSIVGIGAVMNVEASVPIVQSVIPGSPADRAGLRSGDKILTVDGTTTEGEDLETVVKRIRGDAGTTVKLTILHEGDSSPVELSIVREKVVVPAVAWAMIPGTTVADIRLEEFSSGAAKELTSALEGARGAGATGIILDLRNNPGGYVGEAVDIASQFLKDGIVYQQRDRTGKIDTVPVKSGGKATDIPLTVLVDLGTASSAEIVAGAIQDAGRGKLIGQKTFGTGTVLEEFALSDGSALLVGTVEWLTRNGRQIWKHGIEPDIAVESNPPGKVVPPSELPRLGADGLAKSGDAPLLKAIDLLVGR